MTEATHALADRLGSGRAPEVLLVLGSGLSALTEGVVGAVRVPFGDLPGFPDAGLEGHDGTFVAGRLEGRRVLIQSGRFHRYEGHPPALVALPIRVAHSVGARIAIVTNAVGGMGPAAIPGSIVVLEDQIAPSGPGPLVGPQRSGEARFPDMSVPYDAELRSLALAEGAGLGLGVSSGVYAGTLGPAFETRAEIRMLALLGGDVVGMSTVDEVVQARALGMRVLGLSLVTNRAAGLRDEPLTHLEVLDGARSFAAGMESLIRAVVRRLPVSG